MPGPIAIALMALPVLLCGFDAQAGSECAHPEPAIALGAPRPLDTGPLPVAVAIGDFNGDGLPDFATGCDLDALTLHLNLGRGEFAAPWFISNFEYGVRGLASGDLDGDGTDDLVGATWFLGANAVVVYHGGAVPFAIREVYPIPDQPTSVAIGDMDGDALPDLVVSGTADPTDPSTGSRVWVFRNLGKGMFERAAIIAVGQIPRSVVVADFDSDGRLDFAVANYEFDSQSLSVARNLEDFHFAVTAIPLDMVPNDLASGDLNGDGLTDLVAVGSDNRTGDYAQVLINRHDGTFELGQKIPAGQNAYAVAIGDLDNDGKNDAVVGNITGGMISVLRGTGNGGFRARQDWPFDENPRAITLGDLNQDGMLDLLVTEWFSNRVALWLNETPLVARVDLKPGDPANHVSSHSSGQVSLAILGSARIDVRKIDPESVRVNGSPITEDPTDRPRMSFRRIDADAYEDAVLAVPASLVAVNPDGCVLVAGQLNDGRSFIGWDGIRLVGAGNALTVVASGPGEIRLAFPGPVDDHSRIDVFSVRGARIARQNVPAGTSEINLRDAGLGVGIYFVRFTETMGVTFRKVAITH